jgi:hypothetical protein
MGKRTDVEESYDPARALEVLEKSIRAYVPPT